MSEIKITKLPPGRALGAGDLHKWAANRAVGRTGVAGQRDKDLKAWARNPANVGRNGQALSPKELRKRRKAERKRLKRKRKAERKAELYREIEIRRAVKRGELVLWGDSWSKSK